MNALEDVKKNFLLKEQVLSSYATKNSEAIRLKEQEKTLREKKVIFDKLPLEEKCLVLAEILHMFQCQSGSADLKLIEGPRKAGIIVMNSNITKCKSIKIINQSPTGIYEQVIDLQQL